MHPSRANRYRRRVRFGRTVTWGSMRKKLAHELATLALHLDREARDQANRALVKQCLIDAAAAAIAGYDSSAAQMAARFALSCLGSGTASPWLSGVEGISPLGAAFVNSSAMSALDIDDGNRAARGHLGAAVVPAASVFGSVGNVSSDTLVHAVLAGAEIGARLGSAERPPYFSSGRWAGVGAAVAAGICLGFDEETLANSISLAVHTAPLMGATGARTQMTGHIKEGTPFGLSSGLTAALLAAHGYRGDPDAIESAGIYDVSELANMPQQTYAFKRTYFKRYTCCRLAHAPIDAVVEVCERNGIGARDISRIVVRTFRTAIELPNEPRPTSFESAQFSLPFAIAVAVVKGTDALLPLLRSTLEDPDVIAFAERVVVRYEPSLDEFYPAGTPAQVQIETSDGRSFDERRDTADGDPRRPFSDEQLLNKLAMLAQGKLTEARIAAISSTLRQGVPTAREFEAMLCR